MLWCKNVGLDVVCGVNPHPILNGNGAGSESNLKNCKNPQNNLKCLNSFDNFKSLHIYNHGRVYRNY